MLKEATKHFLDDVFAYVMRNRAVMRRPAVRYAIEKMPRNFKTKVVGKRKASTEH
jgi:hypothetical protein